LAEDSTGSNPADRRAYTRYPFSIEGKAWFLSQGASAPWSVTSSNISLGGMMLHCSSERGILLQVGDQLMLGFEEPGGTEQVCIKGRVAWKRMGILSILGPCVFGFEFLDTPPQVEIRKLHDPAANSWAAGTERNGKKP